MAFRFNYVRLMEKHLILSVYLDREFNHFPKELIKYIFDIVFSFINIQCTANCTIISYGIRNWIRGYIPCLRKKTNQWLDLETIVHNAKSVVAGLDHLLVLTPSDRIYDFKFSNGELIHDSFSIVGAEKIFSNGSLQMAVVNKFGDLFIGHHILPECDKIEFPTKVPLAGVLTFCFGSNTKYAITKIYDLYGWENNRNSPANLPIKLNLSNIIQVASQTDNDATIALGSSRNVWSWGNNQKGRLGLGHKNLVKSPQLLNLTEIVCIQCGNHDSYALDKNGFVYIWGSIFKIPTKLKFTNIVSITCGWAHIVATDSTGSHYGSGSDDSNRMTDKSNLFVSQKLDINFVKRFA